MQCKVSENDTHGDFLCSSSSMCNSSSRVCVCTDSNFADDTTFLIIPNCAMPVNALYAGYALAAVFAFFVSFASCATARHRKPQTKWFLYIGALWTFLIPFIQLSHYRDGNRMGYSTIVLFYVVIQLANVQVVMFSFQILSLLALLSKPIVLIQLRKILTYYLAFWSVCKIIPATLLIIGLAISSLDLFNGTVLAWALLLISEVAITTTAQYVAMRRLIIELRSVSESDSAYLHKDKVQAVLEFADRLHKVLPVAVLYAVVVCALGLIVLGLYITFGYAIPFMWLTYILMMVSWPTLALNCVILSRDATVRKIENLQETGDEEPESFSLFVDHGQAIRKQGNVPNLAGNQHGKLQPDLKKKEMMSFAPIVPASPFGYTEMNIPIQPTSLAVPASPSSPISGKSVEDFQSDGKPSE